MISTSEKANGKVIPVRAAGDADLERISREGMLSLTLEEMKTIQAYFNAAGRDPSDAELETIAQTWSEHCYHKTFRAAFEYSEAALDGEDPLAKGPRAYENLLKETVFKATTEMRKTPSASRSRRTTIRRRSSPTAAPAPASAA
jgi:phosphoribosylformylglycinamidine (FGAM) synthase-like enzyme